MPDSACSEQELLIGVQRAEFERAAKLDRWVHRLHWLTAGVSMLAALAAPIKVAFYSLGVLAFLLAILSLWLAWKVRQGRCLAERARRATLLVDGLGMTLSDFELRELRKRSSFSLEEINSYVDAKYYAASADHGWPRLAEMLEESAFFSADLLGASARKSWKKFVILVVALFFVLALLPFVPPKWWVSQVELLLVLAVALVSNEVLGKALAYGQAAAVVGQVEARLETAKARGNKQEDVLLILSDYNSAVESAPLVAPGVFEERKEILNKLWKERKNKN